MKMSEFDIIDTSHSSNPITNIITTYNKNQNCIKAKDEELTKKIEKLNDKKKKLVYPSELKHFIKPLVDLVVIPSYTISTTYLVLNESHAYTIELSDGRTALFYYDKWGDLCISGKEVCEMTEQELSDAVNEWVPTDTDPQLPKEY